MIYCCIKILKLRILRQNETNLFSHIVSENKELGSALDDSDSGNLPFSGGL